MSLLEIKRYMMQVKMASLKGLCIRFNAEPDTLRGMLSHWIRKGCLRVCTKTPACGTQCAKCPAAEIELYEWVSPTLAGA